MENWVKYKNSRYTLKKALKKQSPKNPKIQN